MLRTDLRFCKRKSTDQTKQIVELQNMLAEQQKQTLEYANRLDENDKKSDEMSSKISTLLQELNKCKIELHYWRSRSPATPICNNCGQTTSTMPPAAGDLLALMKQNLTNSRESTINVTVGNSEPDSESDQRNDSGQSITIDHIKQTDMEQFIIKNSKSITYDISIEHLLGSTEQSNDIDSIQLAASTSAQNQASSSSTTTIISSAVATAAQNNDKSVIGSKTSVITTDSLADKKRTASLADSIDVIDPTLNLLANFPKSTIALNAKANVSPSIVTAQPHQAQIDPQQQQNPKKLTNNSSVILTVGTPRFYGKRKADDSSIIASDNETNALTGDSAITSINMSECAGNAASSMASGYTNKTNSTATQQNNLANSANNSNLSDNYYNKKARRVQNKIKFQTSNMNIKTRNK